MAYMIDLLNIVLGDMEDFHHGSWSEATTVYEDLKLKSLSSNNNKNNREQTAARGSSSHPVCGIL